MTRLSDHSNRTSVRRVALGAGGASVALIASFAIGVPADAAGGSYVAMGDSYASGTGTRTYINDGTECLRSTAAYPSLNAASLGLTLNFRACSGATVADVTNTQLSALSTSTRYVTISVGGNDAGFASVITECALPGWMSNCNGKIDGAQNIITNTLPSRLSTLYGSIRAKAPNAKVIVVGYPRIFMGEDCNALTWFSPSEEARLNQMADLLNSKTAAAASANGFTFANPTSRFIGHAVCDNPEWINGLSNPIVNSYHPNVAGHRDGYAPLTRPLFGVSAVRAASSTGLSEATLLKSTKPYAALDRTITPKLVTNPDLTSARAKAAAKKAGVDLSSRASIDRADKVWSTSQDLAWAAARR